MVSSVVCQSCAYWVPTESWAGWCVRLKRIAARRQEACGAYTERHCSLCYYFSSSVSGKTVCMYCSKLRRRITARKQPCKYFDAM